MAFQIGDWVRVSPPFHEVYPDTYQIVAQDAATGAWRISIPEQPDLTPDFADEHLEKVTP